jgi:hypothetical protein
MQDIAGEGPPLIVTLEADAASQVRFDAARERWFPARRNVVPAHLTLFHQLPGLSEGEAALRLHRIAEGTAPLPFRVATVMSLGGGVAFRLEVPGIEAVRGRILNPDDRIAQDRGRIRPHVTVQNKVDRTRAAVTLQAVQAGFAPWDGEGRALRLWRYMRGPWEAAGRFELRGAAADG